MPDRSLQDLVRSDDPAWPDLQQRLLNAANHVEILPADPMDGQRAIQGVQSGADTSLGAMALHCGGLLVDAGWLRILGAGHRRLPGSLLDWNGLGNTKGLATLQGALVVGVDVIGGVFVVNGGGLPGTDGNVFYFSTDTHRWEDLDRGYTAWLAWVADGDLAGFYNHLRWADWEDDLELLGGDQGLHLWPQPWMVERFDPDEATRQVVPIDKLIQLSFTGRPPADEPSN